MSNYGEKPVKIIDVNDNIRLLKEMEEKIEKNVLRSLRIKELELDFIAHFYQDDMNIQNRINLNYNLNRKNHRVTFISEYGKVFSNDDHEKFISDMVNELARSIASNLLTTEIFNNEEFAKFIGITRKDVDYLKSLEELENE